MKKICFTLLVIIALSTFSTGASACFGDKLGIGYVKGITQSEFSAHLIAIYIKEKTGIDSVVNEFNTQEAVDKSLKKGETDIIIWTGYEDSFNIEKLAEEKKESRFILLARDVGIKIRSEAVVLEISKKVLEDIRFFTLNKVMDRLGGLINHDDFIKSIIGIREGKVYPKQAAREYLLEKDLI